MTGKTHVMGGTLTGLCWMGLMPPSNYMELGLMVGATSLGSLLPDIDHHSSRVTNTNIFTKVIGGFVSGIFKHRHEVHTIFACIVFGILGYFLTLGCGELILSLMAEFGISWKGSMSPYAMVVAVGFFLGSMNHLVWDTFNPQGILWLYPKKTRVSICFIQTGSIFETVFYCINAALVAIVSYILWNKGVFLC